MIAKRFNRFYSDTLYKTVWDFTTLEEYNRLTHKIFDTLTSTALYNWMQFTKWSNNKKSFTMKDVQTDLDIKYSTLAWQLSVFEALGVIERAGTKDTGGSGRNPILWRLTV